MSIAKDFAEGEKLVLSASVFWQQIEEEYAGALKSKESRRRWRRLSMMHLYVQCNWTCEMIGNAFGVHRCNVSRAINTCRRELQEKFSFAPHDRDSEGIFDEPDPKTE